MWSFKEYDKRKFVMLKKVSEYFIGDTQPIDKKKSKQCHTNKKHLLFLDPI